MAGQPDISSILAALAAQRPANTPTQGAQATGQLSPPQPSQLMHQGYPLPFTASAAPAALPAYGLPQPVHSGSMDLSAIKPVNTGSVSIAEAIAKAKGIAAEKGISRDDARHIGRSYRRSRSRSRSPPRRDSYRDNHNPYRDERRDDPRRGGGPYGRDRSHTPPRGHGGFSPLPARTYGRDRSPGGRGGDDDNSETIVIDSALVGLVIGRQGENLRRVETDTGTRIQFLTGPESAGPQRQCRISGNPRARADAKREINRIIDENGGNPAKEAYSTGRGGGSGKGGQGQSRSNQPALRDGENSVQIMVPDRTVGLIIGRGGETIRDLQERSGCHVNIVGENKSVNGLRPVNLIGSQQAAARAKELILEIVDSDTRTQGQAAQSRDLARSGADVHSGAEGYAAGGNKINDKVMVPSEAVGMIIGKGGEAIREMQNLTGCKINVSPPAGADAERAIGLVGTRAAIEDAKRAIMEKVDSVREKNGGGGSRRGARENDHYSSNDQYSQSQQPYGQPSAAQGFPLQQQQTAATGVGGDASGGDPYAAWGGYQNYAAMWYAALAQQQQGQQGQTPGQTDQYKPPGTA